MVGWVRLWVVGWVRLWEDDRFVGGWVGAFVGGWVGAFVGGWPVCGWLGGCVCGWLGGCICGWTAGLWYRVLLYRNLLLEANISISCTRAPVLETSTKQQYIKGVGGWVLCGWVDGWVGAYTVGV